uniref:Uncharacterized protein n=1 Tax=Aureoumbra lagunensis TaxID=44058 RepID=A0A7S3NJF2_9STRA
MEHIQATGQHSLFICASQNVYNAHLKISHGGSYWPKSLFITSDIHGVCRFAHSIVNNVTLNTHNVSSSIVCIDRPPVHITKDKRQPLSNRYLSRLDDHQITLLQWYLLTRSRWLTHVGRSGGHDVCKSATREGTHHVHVPGNSFYGWALAASGLLPPRPQFAYARNCPCDINKNHISVWEPPP